MDPLGGRDSGCPRPFVLYDPGTGAAVPRVPGLNATAFSLAEDDATQLRRGRRIPATAASTCGPRGWRPDGHRRLRCLRVLGHLADVYQIRSPVRPGDWPTSDDHGRAGVRDGLRPLGHPPGHRGRAPSRLRRGVVAAGAAVQLASGGSFAVAGSEGGGGLWETTRPDSGTLAVANDSTEVFFFDAATGKENGRPLTGHIGSVAGLAYSTDGKSVLTARLRGLSCLERVHPRRPGHPGGPLWRRSANSLSVPTAAPGPPSASSTARSTCGAWIDLHLGLKPEDSGLLDLLLCR
ncbi:hypothetical protein QFZ76_000587 [Streptomyces sp. V4I2]|nr:hypothetical protein [Streptomyces sp. V4I2]